MALEHSQFAKKFYNSTAWKKARKNYIESPEVAGLCEHCLKQGLYERGYILDHIIEINIDNINDTNITLNPDNFQFLCLFHHNRKTFSKTDKSSTQEGYGFNSQGQYVPLSEID